MPKPTVPKQTSNPWDVLHLGTYRAQLSQHGNRSLSMALVLHVIGGVLEGLALLALLPISIVLSQGGTSYGLGLGGWIGVVAVLATVFFVLRYWETLVGYGAALDVLKFSHRAIGNQLARLPLGWFQGNSTGGLSRMLTEGLMSIGNVLAHVLGMVITNGTALLVIMIGSWAWDWRLGLVLTLTAPLGAGVMLLAQRLRRRGEELLAPTEAEVADRIVEFASRQSALRAAGRAQGFKPLHCALRRNTRASWANLWYSTAGLILNGLVMQVVIVVLMSVAASLAVAEQLQPLQTLAFMGMTLRMTTMLADLGAYFSMGLVAANAPLAQVREILDAPVLPEPAQSAPITEPGAVTLEHVSFGYRPDAPVIRDVSFHAEPGTMTAIVGFSGSGKTTLARLIARFWEVDSGRIRVGGVDIREQSTEQLMSQLSMVFQDTYLFNDTLENNIKVGNPAATDAQVRTAATMAGVTDVVGRLPHGWQTRVGEGGRSLSGGERQRVAIARALLKQAPIVLFDEATSALDADNEANVLASMDALRKHSTVLVIAHKLATIKRADRIVVLNERGEIAEHGTHQQLYAAQGLYRHFLDMRASAAGWSLLAPK